MSACTTSSAIIASPRTRRTTTCCRPSERATFQGYRRANGRTGTRNYLGILTSRELLAPRSRASRPTEVERSGMLADYPGHRRHRRHRARHRLRPCGLWRGLRGPAPHPMGLCQPSEFRRRGHGRARLRGVPDRPHEEGIRADGDRHLPHADDPGDGRHEEDRGGHRRPRSATCCRSPRGRSAKRVRPPNSIARPAMRRLGRLFGAHRQPGARRRLRPPGPPRRHLDPVRDARDLRRRAPAHPPRRDARGRREARRRASTGGRTTPPATAAR